MSTCALLSVKRSAKRGYSMIPCRGGIKAFGPHRHLGPGPDHQRRDTTLVTTVLVLIMAVVIADEEEWAYCPSYESREGSDELLNISDRGPH